MATIFNKLKKLDKFVPNTRWGRLFLGIALLVGGVLGFLPVLGFWMIPLGLMILSMDYPSVRKFRRRWQIRIGRKWNRFRS